MNWIEKKWYNSQLNKIKKSVKLLKEFNEIMYNMTEEQKRELDKEKEKIYLALLGNKENNVKGMIDIFDVTDEDKSFLNEEKIRKMSLSELIELFEELIEELKKNI